MRADFLSYCLPDIGDDEIAEVVATLRSGWLTTGPRTKRFERVFSDYVRSSHAVAVSSCTAGLHVALAALGVGPGDEVIAPTFTFCSTVHVILQAGATPVLADVAADDLCLDPEDVRRRITPRTRAIIPVHYGGQPCKMNELMEIAAEHGLLVVEDAAHALGARYKGQSIGTIGQATAFSFYPTKNITTGEGGMVTVADAELARQMATWALHGISRDAWNRYSAEGSWYYEVTLPGFKYNMTDIQAAIGTCQLAKLNNFLERRRAIAHLYNAVFSGVPELETPIERPDVSHAWHLYPLQLRLERLRIGRADFIVELARRNIGASVHFIPVHVHPYYRDRFGYQKDDFPVASSAYQRLVSLPLYPKMSDRDVDDVIEAVLDIVKDNRRS